MSDDKDIPFIGRQPAEPGPQKRTVPVTPRPTAGERVAAGAIRLWEAIRPVLARAARDVRAYITRTGPAEPWMKAAVVFFVGAAVTWLAYGAVSAIVAEASHSSGPQVGFDRSDLPSHTGLMATVTQALHIYFGEHTSGLPVDDTTAYEAWKLAGIGFFLWAFAFRAFGARLGWAAYGAATTVMVWQATAPAARPVAAGVVVLGWLVLSVFALRGLSILRFSSYSTHHHTHTSPQIRVEPTIHVTAQVEPPVIEKVTVRSPMDWDD
ncbi:hypothetical protein ACFV4P_34350 [Kitasatospora sp. NPDC059795]|uniref:hypothetical protein n=1 Tax=Kitasatospora sp. NPDC059795 TaxID=3346949 RepID=UPI0036531734